MNNPEKNSQLGKYGPYALVTGASEGIGRAFAEELAKLGFEVILVARRTELLDELAKRLEEKYGVMCPVITADLTNPEDFEDVFLKIKNLDIGLFVCNAGFGTAGDFLNSDLSNELNMLSLNCATLTAMTHYFGNKFRQKGKGGIILLSSIVALQGVARSAHYSATKAYVHTLGEALQVEWQGSGVDLLIVAPGPVETGFALRSKMELGNAATPDTVARESIGALGRRKVVRPGLLAKKLAFLLSTVPRWAKVKIMSSVMSGMTKRLP
jgi:short-subunit dehydrogenase